MAERPIGLILLGRGGPHFLDSESVFLNLSPINLHAAVVSRGSNFGYNHVICREPDDQERDNDSADDVWNGVHDDCFFVLDRRGQQGKVLVLRLAPEGQGRE